MSSASLLVPVTGHGPASSLNEDGGNVGIGLYQGGRLPCLDTAFYRTILRYIIYFAELDVQGASPFGLVRYLADEDYTLEFGTTSEEAAREGVLKVWMVAFGFDVSGGSNARVCRTTSWFHEYTAKIVIGQGGVV